MFVFMSLGIMSSSPSSFKETDALFLVFVDEFNNAGRSPSMDDNSGESLYFDDNYEHIDYF